MDRKAVPVAAVLQPTFSASGDNPNTGVPYLRVYANDSDALTIACQAFG